ncbi:unnamed protein product [Mycoplasma amphoriforme A39]|uniref:Uncharacterized protein n=2 Tax=Mycoplasma TaxID=2093 RepID=A0A292IH79_9MOLU|nr:unnamed protein product [Mycoplasma amphoriforme A39]
MLKPIINIVNKSKKNIFNFYLDSNQKKVINNRLFKKKIFDNLIAMVFTFWQYRQQNIFNYKIDYHNVKPDSNWKLFYQLFTELYHFSNLKLNETKDYFSQQDNLRQSAQKYAQKFLQKITSNYANFQNNAAILTNVLEALINFNFIDLYTFKIKITTSCDYTKIDQYLAKLIRLQMDYLDKAYKVFQDTNSVNFNIFFKIIISLRKNLL